MNSLFDRTARFERVAEELGLTAVDHKHGGLAYLRDDLLLVEPGLPEEEAYDAAVAALAQLSEVKAIRGTKTDNEQWIYIS